MKSSLLIALLSLSAATASAQQTVAGTTYFLPKTVLRFSIMVERQQYTPGQFAQYAGKYMKKPDTPLTPASHYRIVGVKMTAVGVPDSTKQHTLALDKKLTIDEVDRDESGILLAVNAKGRRTALPEAFSPAKQPALPNPQDFMNEDILSAGSMAKMAELTAKDIYDIRDSRAQLSRGQADFMPKDGAQLRMMMDRLDLQERALLQTFEGVTATDTTETVITYTPQGEVGREPLFRFSQKLGMTDADDLAGEPYYITVTPDGNVPAADTPAGGKEAKDNFGLYVNIPDKIHVTLTQGQRRVASYDLYAGQYGRTESLSAELFGKKTTSHLVINPVSGSIEKIESETLK